MGISVETPSAARKGTTRDAGTRVETSPRAAVKTPRLKCPADFSCLDDVPPSNKRRRTYFTSRFTPNQLRQSQRKYDFPQNPPDRSGVSLVGDVRFQSVIKNLVVVFFVSFFFFPYDLNAARANVVSVLADLRSVEYKPCPTFGKCLRVPVLTKQRVEQERRRIKSLQTELKKTTVVFHL